MLRIADRVFDPELVVFDKDGTLIAFDRMWHTWFAHLMEAIASQVSLDAEIRESLAGTLGCNLDTDEWDPQGPLTIASTGEVGLLIAGQLYRHLGGTWDGALGLVHKAETTARELLMGHDLVDPIGDVRARLQGLKDHGLRLALATTDARVSTERTLGKLGIASLFETMICGDDGIPLKPAPDMGLEICRRLGVAPPRAMMVGDTVADMDMARRAGYGQAIAVTSGALTREMLAPFADLVITDIHAIEVLPPAQAE